MPTPFEIACTKEAMGAEPWPDLSTLVFKAPVVVVETRSCIRCTKPVEGDRCPSCRAHQGTYAASS
jgi:rubrerythrin